jgi:hypothetical protein
MGRKALEISVMQTGFFNEPFLANNASQPQLFCQNYSYKPQNITTTNNNITERC